MVHAPSTQDEISDSIQTRLQGRITKLTSFVESSFNKLFLDAFSDIIYEYEVRLLAAQLSGWVEYAGGPITQEDLDRLGIENFDNLDALNSHMEDDHLDNIGSLVGVSRSPGKPATGSVRIDVFDDKTRVPDELEVSTPPNVDGDVLVFQVDLDGSQYVTPNDQGNSNHVDVDVVAVENGSEYNIGAGRIQNFRAPPPGLESVNNSSEITGGEDEESNEDLRVRIKNAVFETSGGGTTAGIEGYIISNVDGVNGVFVDEFFNKTPVFVDVVVDGGTEADVEDAIETSRPAGIEHNLVRPVTHKLAVDIELRGTDIDQLTVKDEIENYIFDLNLDEDFISYEITQRILNIEPNIENILAINTRVVEVTNDRITFNSGTNKYDLAESPLGRIDDEDHYYSPSKDVYSLNAEPVDSSTVEVRATVNDQEDQLLTGSGTDYSVVDNDSDGMFDAIDFSGGNTVPDDGTTFTVDYDTITQTSETFTYDGSQDYELTYLPALAADSTVSDAGGTSYTLGTDYDIVDTDGDDQKDTIRWLSGGSTPNNSQDFTVTYEIDAGSINSVTGVLNGNEHTFTEGVDFNELDGDSDGRPDQIDWSLSGDTPDDGTTFSVDSTVETEVDQDYFVSQREKITPVVEEITVTVYE